MKIIRNLCIVLVLSLASCGLGPDYNLSVNPPGQNDTPEQIFPAEINGDEAKVNQLESGGLEYTYGSDKSITVARLTSEDEAIAFFKQNVLPNYQKQNNNFSGTINGQFYAKAGGNWKMFGWVNGNFAFSIKASDQEKLDDIIDTFKYIEHQ